MRRLLRLFASAGLIIFASGCATRTVALDTQADVVRLGPGVRGKVYVWKDPTGWTLTGPVHLPEGWYAGPGPRYK